MPSYRLVDDGYPTYKKIVTGRKWIGRVCKIKDGFLGIIGKTEFKAYDERACFDGVVALHCGFASPEQMDARNAQVRAQNRAAREAGRYVADEMLRGNFLPLEKMLGRLDKGS
jgi:hypothetical protein